MSLSEKAHIPSPFPPASSGDETVCPFCKTDLRGERISNEDVRDSYDGELDPEVEHYYSRLIGIEVQGHYDGVSEWMCPDCAACWPRAGLPLSPHMREARDRDLALKNAQPPDRPSPLAEA